MWKVKVSSAHTVEDIMLAHTLRAFLEENNVQFDQWGKGEAKTFENLLAEIASGEATLEKKHGVPCRSITISALDVYHDDGVRLLLLREKKQLFSDGRSRIRKLDRSIGEKQKSGETPSNAAHRALVEELGITETLLLFAGPLITKGPLPSLSFPGLFTFYNVYVFDVFLPKHLYRANGYVERQKEKTSYFVWEKCREFEARM